MRLAVPMASPRKARNSSSVPVMIDGGAAFHALGVVVKETSRKVNVVVGGAG